MCNRTEMQRKAKEAYDLLPEEVKELVRIAGHCSPSDITKKFKVVSIEEMISRIEVVEIDFPCSCEDQANLIPGFDDEPQFPKAKRFSLITQRGNPMKYIEGSFVLPV